MATASYTEISNVDGESETRSVVKTADNVQKYGGADTPITLPAANAMETYLNDDDGTASGTLADGHTLVDGIADLYWGTNNCRYGCTVDVTPGTVDTVDISGGSGDALPADATPCTIANQVQVDVTLDGDASPYVDVIMTRRGHATFKDAGGDTIHQAQYQANTLVHWDEDMDEANPYTGDPITVAWASCGESAGAGELRIKFLRDATP